MEKVLKLDFDKSKPDINHLRFVTDILNIRVKDVLAHKTNKGYHVRIYIKNDIKECGIVLIQSLMGSDLKRETLNYDRVKRGESNWNVLFSIKESVNGKRLSSEKLDKRLTNKLQKSLTTKKRFSKLKGLSNQLLNEIRNDLL